jgi:hypothetical protein
LRALSLVCGRYSACHPSTFLRSLRSTVVTRFVATTDALTPTSQRDGLFAHGLHQHWRVSLIIALGLPAIPPPTIDVSSGDRPAARRFGSSPIARFAGFVIFQQTRPTTPTESSSRRPSYLDSLCYGLVVLSPLLSTPPCCDAVTVRYRTIPHRTETDFHRSIPSPSQAHWNRLPAGKIRPPAGFPSGQHRITG